MRKILTAVALSISLCAFGQEGTQPGTTDNEELQTTRDKPGNTIGVHMGYFMSIGASYQHFFNQWMAVDLNAGYRWKYGLAGEGPNTRIGAFGVVQAHLLQVQINSVELSLYPAAGGFVAHANYDYPDRQGGLAGDKFFVGGITAGVGGDLRMGRFNLTGMFLPGLDLTQKKEVEDGWFINRCSGIALRYILAR